MKKRLIIFSTLFFLLIWLSCTPDYKVNGVVDEYIPGCWVEKGFSHQQVWVFPKIIFKDKREICLDRSPREPIIIGSEINIHYDSYNYVGDRVNDYSIEIVKPKPKKP